MAFKLACFDNYKLSTGKICRSEVQFGFGKAFEEGESVVKLFFDILKLQNFSRLGGSIQLDNFPFV